MSLHLQPRDLAIFSDLGRYGLLNTSMLQGKHWPSVGLRACQQRLRVLVDAGLLKKANLIVAHQTAERGKPSIAGGSIPTAYALTPHGAEVLEQSTGEKAKRVSRSDPAAMTLLHRLEVVQMMIELDESCRQKGLPLPEWIHEHDTLPNTKLGDAPEARFVLYERYATAQGEATCRPDASCWLRIPKRNREGEYDHLLIYWEIDRATNSTASELGKVAGYHALSQAQTFQNHWPLAIEPVVRIFYVCPTPERLNSLVQTVQAAAATKDYRFTTKTKATCPGILVDPIWETTKGELLAIYKGGRDSLS